MHILMCVCPIVLNENEDFFANNDLNHGEKSHNPITADSKAVDQNDSSILYWICFDEFLLFSL